MGYLSEGSAITRVREAIESSQREAHMRREGRDWSEGL